MPPSRRRGPGIGGRARGVKTLAAQKATGDIGAQITGMRAATHGPLPAIKEIGATIGRVSEIASIMAAAVKEQGAATQEIWPRCGPDR